MGESRRDPATGDMHHFDDDGRLREITYEDSETGQIVSRSFVNPRFAYVPSGPYTPTLWERARWGWLPAMFVLGSALGVWSAGYISGVEVLLYPALAWAGFAAAVRAGKSPWAAGFGLWALMIAWIFVRGIAVAD